MKASYLPLFFAIILVGCSQANDSSDDSDSTSSGNSFTKDFSSLASGETSWALDSTSSSSSRQVQVSLTLPSAETKVYLVLTNTKPSGEVSLGSVDPTATTNSRSISTSLLSTSTRLRRKDLSELRSVSVPSLNRSASRAAITDSPVEGAYSVNSSTFTFIDHLSSLVTYENKHPSTLRKQVIVGEHTLNIWVADDCWSTSTSTDSALTSPATAGISTYWKAPDHLVNQTMVDALANEFLADGANDVYGWVTGIFGQEWSTSDAPSGYDGTLVDSQGNLHIVVTNLNPDGTDDGVLMGYFYALNNYLNDSISGAKNGISNSNQKVLFALNADSLADPDDDGDSDTTDDQSEWSIDDSWPADLVSTLAHEFQHMIHFYQKQVLNGLSDDTDTWVNEMASLVTEDLVSAKLNVLGPRGVLGSDLSTGDSGNTGGRLPYFNYLHDVSSLTSWDDDSPVYYSYPNAYAFGAWLVRNYGGPALLRAMVQSSGTTYEAVVSAVNAVNGTSHTWADLVRQWGVATLLAGGTTSPYAYSNGDSGYSWTLDSETYTAGSIDLNNYSLTVQSQVYEGPYISSSAPSGSTMLPSGASYFYLATTATGSFSRTLTLPAGLDLATVVVVQ